MAIASLLGSVWLFLTSVKSGRTLLTLVVGAGFLVVNWAGLFCTSDSISRERREGTLGLLFLTDLKPMDVVLGKLCAKGLVPFSILLGLVPAITVSVISGGVTGGEVVRLAIAMLNALFCALAAGILASRYAIEQRRAVLLAFLLILAWFYLTLVPVGANPSASAIANGSVRFWLSPLMPLMTAGAGDLGFSALGAAYWGSLVLTQLLGWGCLFMAAHGLMGLQRRELAGAAMQQGTGSNGEVGPRVGEGDPVAWLGMRGKWEEKMIGLMIGFFALGIMSLLAIDSTAFLIGWLVLLFVLKIKVATEASHGLAQDRQSGLLESLLSLPLSTSSLARGLIKAIHERFLRVILAMIACSSLAAFVLWRMGSKDHAQIVAVVGLASVIDFPALCWTGMWKGVSAETPSKAVSGTVFRVIVLPWLAWLCSFGFFFHASTTSTLAMWLFVRLFSSAFAYDNSKNHFLNHFREMALRPYQGKGPHVESEWSPIDWSELESDVPPRYPAAPGG